MKKYLFLTVILVSSILIGKNQPSYAINTCQLIDGKSLANTKNLIEYLNNNYNESTIDYICSNDLCYYLRGEDISNALDNFIILLNKNHSSDINLEANVKGYLITKIGINQC